MKKKMVLADCDERYLKELSYYFMENVPQLELITFTRRERMCRYFQDGNRADIVMVDEALADLELKDLTSGMTRIVMARSMISVDGFETVKKYQRMESLSDAVLLKYAENEGTLETVKGSSETRITVFFSPAGGTGKTTLSLAFAAAGARAGLNILYLNLEEIDSVGEWLGKTRGNLSDVFLALKTKGMNAGLKLKGSTEAEANAGFHYVSGVESISEYEEINAEDMRRLLKTIQELSIYDLVVVDPPCGFTGQTKAVLREADTIFVPVVPEEGNIEKLQRLIRESRLHDTYDFLFQKMYLIMNRVHPGGSTTDILPEEIRSRLPYCTSVMADGILAGKGNILRFGDRLLQVMNPMLQIGMGNR